MSTREETRLALVERFRHVAQERLTKLNRLFLDIEHDPSDAAAVDELMREIHTLKGEAKLVGMPVVNTVAHRTEDLLIHARQHAFRLAPDAINTVLHAFDLMLELVQATGAQGSRSDAGVDVLLAKIDDALHRAPPGEVAHSDPQPQPARVAQPERAAMPAGDEAYVRIDTATLDRLSGAGRDMFLAQLRIERMLRRITSEVRRRQLGVDLVGELRAASEHVFENKLRIESLEQEVQALRLRPLGSVFDQIPRAVRDLAMEQGKQIKVKITDHDVRVDQRVLEAIGEPLLHLIRNAVDHGIEPPAERVAAGKAEQGTISLGARRFGSEVRITVTDDGRGISPRAIREVAVAKGLVSGAAADTLSDEAWLELLFRPGFTTRKQATDVSGRGIGLDLVKQRTMRLGGTVAVSGQPAQGTTFTLVVPVTLALTRAMVLKAGEQIYAVACEYVESVLNGSALEVEQTGDVHVLRIDGDIVPLSPLESVCGTPAPKKIVEDRAVVVLNHGAGKLAVSASAVLGIQEILQQPPNGFLGSLGIFEGSTLLEDGQLALLLDVNALAARAPSSGGVAWLGAATRATTVLVADDSEITRDLICSLLREWGHEVLEAVDGRDALRWLEATKVDAVITDLEMPVLDGLGLLRNIRANDGTKALPVIVLTTRGSDEDKRAAADAGADAYVIKTEFREQDLHALLKRHLEMS